MIEAKLDRRKTIVYVEGEPILENSIRVTVDRVNIVDEPLLSSEKKDIGIDKLGAYRYLQAVYKSEKAVCKVEVRDYYESSLIEFLARIEGVERGKFVEAMYPVFSYPKSTGKDRRVVAVSLGDPYVSPILKVYRSFDEALSDTHTALLLEILDERWSLAVLPVGPIGDVSIARRRGEFASTLKGYSGSIPISLSTYMYGSRSGPSETLLELGSKLDCKPQPLPEPLSKLGYSTAEGSYYYGRLTGEILARLASELEKIEPKINWIELGSPWYSCPLNDGLLRRTLYSIYRRLTGKLKFRDRILYRLNLESSLKAARKLTPHKKVLPEDFKPGLNLGFRIWSTHFTPSRDVRRSYRFIDGTPADRGFWVETARRLKQMKAILVELDNISRLKFLEKFKVIGAKEKWLKQVLDAFSEESIFVKLCMTPGDFYLANLNLNVNVAVETGSSGRFTSTPDRLYQNIFNSLLAQAFGLHPSFDPMLTSSKSYRELASHTPPRRSRSRFQSFVLAQILCSEIVCIGDREPDVDRSLLKLICYTDGSIVKPKRPAVPAKSCYFKDILKGEYPLVVYTRIGELDYTAVAVFELAGVEQKYTVDLREVGLEPSEYVVYEYFTEQLSPVFSKIEGRVDPGECRFYIVAPTVAGLAVIGDKNKILMPHSLKSSALNGETLVLETESPDPQLLLLQASGGERFEIDGLLLEETAGKNELVELNLKPGRHTVQVYLEY